MKPKEDLRLDPLTGQYEFYLGDNYHKLTLFVEKGQLKIRESRSSVLPLTPLDAESQNNLLFSGLQRGKPFRIEFSRKPDGTIPGFHFISGSLVIPVTRQAESYLKKKYTVSELQEDFQQFRKLVESKAVSRYEFTTKEEFDRLFDTAYNLIRSPMSIREFYSLLLPLKEKIGCGHTHLDYPGEYRKKVQVRKFPLVMTLIDGRCYLLEDLCENSEMGKFSEITGINGIPMKSLVKTVTGDISADGYNNQFKKAAFSSCFQYYYANRYGVPGKYNIGFRDVSSGREDVATLPAIACKSINYSNRKAGELDFRSIPEFSAAVMTIPSFSYYRERNKIFFKFIDQAFRKIKERKIDNVILDLRGNGGGDPWCGSYLLSYLEKEPVKYFAEPYPGYEKLSQPVPPASENRYTGKLVVLMDRSNFSTSGHFLSLLKFHKMGTLIGEETGSTYTCNGAVKGFTLKNTRIYVKLSTRAYAAAVKGFDEQRGILPDISITPAASDLFTGRDSIMDKAMEVVKTEKPIRKK